MGEKQVVWDPEDGAEVERAEHEFNVLKAADFHIYHNGKAVAKFAKTHGHFLASKEAIAFPDDDKPKASRAKATAKVKEVPANDAK